MEFRIDQGYAVLRHISMTYQWAVGYGRKVILWLFSQIKRLPYNSWLLWITYYGTFFVVIETSKIMMM